jgi:hypothetical protein
MEVAHRSPLGEVRSCGCVGGWRRPLSGRSKGTGQEQRYNVTDLCALIYVLYSGASPIQKGGRGLKDVAAAAASSSSGMP